MPNDHTADMTTEELDRLIAERSKPENRPKWWSEDEGKSESQLRHEGARRGKVRRLKGAR